MFVLRRFRRVCARVAHADLDSRQLWTSARAAVPCSLCVLILVALALAQDIGKFLHVYNPKPKQMEKALDNFVRSTGSLSVTLLLADCALATHSRLLRDHVHSRHRRSPLGELAPHNIW